MSGRRLRRDLNRKTRYIHHPLQFENASRLVQCKAWPAMRVISLGIRTVPVLSVAKKLAAQWPTPTAPAAKCGLIRQDEAD